VLIGLAMMLAGGGLVYWEIFIRGGRIRIIGLLVAVLVGVGGGIAMMVRSLARVCAKCGTEVDTTELAFPESHLGAVHAYATTATAAEHLMRAPSVRAEDQRRAIVALEGCSNCRRSIGDRWCSWGDTSAPRRRRRIVGDGSGSDG